SSDLRSVADLGGPRRRAERECGRGGGGGRRRTGCIGAAVPDGCRGRAHGGGSCGASDARGVAETGGGWNGAGWDAREGGGGAARARSGRRMCPHRWRGNARGRGSGDARGRARGGGVSAAPVVATSQARDALLGVYRPAAPVFVAGRGAHLIDENGTEYLDFTAGIGVTALGHGDAGVMEAIAAAAATGIIHTSNLYR